jgi:hypothetical protein
MTDHLTFGLRKRKSKYMHCESQEKQKSVPWDKSSQVVLVAACHKALLWMIGSVHSKHWKDFVHKAISADHQHAIRSTSSANKGLNNCRHAMVEQPVSCG